MPDKNRQDPLKTALHRHTLNTEITKKATYSYLYTMLCDISNTRYDTFIPTLYHQRKEHLLPIEFRQSITKKFAYKIIIWSPHTPTHASFRTERSADTEKMMKRYMRKQQPQNVKQLLSKLPDHTSDYSDTKRYSARHSSHASFRTKRSTDTESKRQSKTKRPQQSAGM